MTAQSDWKAELAAFFDTRGRSASLVPSVEELCFIAGRDPRLWRDERLLDDLRRDIVLLMGASSASSVLEIGCAGGFLAHLMASEVAAYVGIDVAPGAVEAARRLGIAKATFEVGDGESLAFADGSFDAAFCYDVFTNFPTFEVGVPLIREMLRVVRPGGRVLVGSVPDRAKSADLPNRVAEIVADLDRRYGPMTSPARTAVPKIQQSDDGRSSGSQPTGDRQFGFLRFLSRVLNISSQAPSVRAVEPVSTVTPRIITYDFVQKDFSKLADRLGVKVEIADVHDLNPYKGYRFNAIYSRETV